MPSLQFVITDQMSLLSPLNSNDWSIPLRSRSRKTVQSISKLFACWRKDPEPGGGPKTCESGSRTLILSHDRWQEETILIGTKCRTSRTLASPLPRWPAAERSPLPNLLAQVNHFNVKNNIYFCSPLSPHPPSAPRPTSYPIDHITIKTPNPNPKCRLYWCLIEFIDWTYNQSVSHVGIFDLSCKLTPLYLLSRLPSRHSLCE